MATTDTTPTPYFADDVKPERQYERKTLNVKAKDLHDGDVLVTADGDGPVVGTVTPRRTRVSVKDKNGVEIATPYINDDFTVARWVETEESQKAQMRAFARRAILRRRDDAEEEYEKVARRMADALVPDHKYGPTDSMMADLVAAQAAVRVWREFTSVRVSRPEWDAVQVAEYLANEYTRQIMGGSNMGTRSLSKSTSVMANVYAEAHVEAMLDFVRAVSWSGGRTVMTPSED